MNPMQIPNMRKIFHKSGLEKIFPNQSHILQKTELQPGIGSAQL
jgi:hypothetical protein